MDSKRLIADWWDHHRRSVGGRSDRLSIATGEAADAVVAWRIVSDLVDSGAPGVVGFLADLNDAAPPGKGSEVVGAGPLEDLLHYHGDNVVDEVVLCARQRSAFRDALAGVWLDDSILHPATVRRLQDLAV